MKALSLIQPWATLVAEGHKRYETRSWQTSYRGPIAIHASKGFPLWAQELSQTEPFLTVLNRPPWEFPRGAIIAIAELVDCVSTGVGVAALDLDELERNFGDFSFGRFAWELDNVQELQYPIPCKGSLGLWDVPPPIEQLLRDTLENPRWAIRDKALPPSGGAGVG